MSHFCYCLTNYGNIVDAFYTIFLGVSIYKQCQKFSIAEKAVNLSKQKCILVLFMKTDIR